MAVIAAAAVAGQIAPAVGGDDPDTWMSVQDATKYQVRERDRRLQGLADDVTEVMALDSLAERGPEWMDEYHSLQDFRSRPKRGQQGIIEFAPIDRGGDLHSLQTQVSDGVIELLDSQLRVLERNRTESNEAFGMANTRFGDVSILYADQLAREFVFCPIIVLGWRRAQYLNIRAHGVHVGDSEVNVCKLGYRGRKHHGVIVSNGPLTHALAHLFQFGLFVWLIGNQPFNGRRENMAMEIDGPLLCRTPDDYLRR